MAPKTAVTAAQKKEILASVKKGLSIPKTAAAVKLPGSVVDDLYYEAEVIADPSLAIKGTPKQVAKAIVAGRNATPGVRWERLASRSGKTVAEVKAIFESESGGKAAGSYTGRGRRFDSSAPAKKAPTSKPATAKKGAAARVTPVGKSKTAPARAKTRAARQAKVGKTNPS